MNKFDAIPYIKELVQKLARIDNVEKVNALATKLPDIHYIDFELEIKPGIELSHEVWDKIQDLVIDCEWQLRDESGEKWYFRPQIANNLTCYQDSQVIANSNQFKNVEVGIKI